MPFWDEWLFVPFLEKVAHGQATLDDWLAPNNEHVVLVPRILLAGLAFTLGWNLWFGMAASLLFATATALLLRRLSRSADSQGPLLLAADLATALLVFSLVQWENWLWGMQSAWFLVNLCVAVALLALRPGSASPPPRRIAVAAAACLVATVTIGQGPFSWIALLPLVAWAPGGARARVVRVASWLGLSLAAFGLLLLGLRQIRHPPAAEAALCDPLAVVQFFFVLLGAPLGPDSDVAAWLGALLLVTVLVLGFASVRGADRVAALPWCALGAFAGMVAAATAVSRFSKGLDYALSSRYATNAVLLWIAAWQLTRLRLLHLPRPVARAATGALLTALCAGLFVTSRGAISSANAEYLRRSAAKACLELGALLEPTRLNDGSRLYLFMRPAGVPQRLARLVELGVRKTRPHPTFVRTGDGRAGVLTRASSADAGTRGGETVAGWVMVEDRDHPPVLLLSANEGRSFIAALQVVAGVSPFGIHVRFNSPSVAEWEVPLEANGPRPHAQPVSAWRFEPGRNVISRLAGATP